MIERANDNDVNKIKLHFRNLYSQIENDFWFKEEYEPKEFYYAIDNNNNITHSMVAKSHILSLKNKKIGYAHFSHIFQSTNKEEYVSFIKEVVKEMSYQYLLTIVETDEKNIYKELGFEPMYIKKTYQINRDCLPEVGNIGITNSFKAEDLYDLYYKYCEHFDGYKIRNLNCYKKMMEYWKINHYKVILYQDNNKINYGYLVYDNSTYPIKVVEAVYLNSISLIKMLAYLLNYKDSLTISLSDSEKIEKIINNLQVIKTSEIYAKITDYDLFNKLFNTYISSISELRKITKPLMMNEDY